MLKLRANLTPSHRLYVALLMMSNLHYFGSSQSDLTSSFEEIGVAVFRWLLPAHADVHRFGKGQNNEGRYQGHIWKKIKQLADDLECAPKCTKDDFAINDNGDGGLDLVGWVSWNDSTPGRLLILGQCACTPEWAKKQDEASGAFVPERIMLASAATGFVVKKTCNWVPAKPPLNALHGMTARIWARVLRQGSRIARAAPGMETGSSEASRR